MLRNLACQRKGHVADSGRRLNCYSEGPAVLKDSFYFLLGPPLTGGSRGSVWTVIFLQKLGFGAGSGEGDSKFDFHFDFKYSQEAVGLFGGIAL